MVKGRPRRRGFAPAAGAACAAALVALALSAGSMEGQDLLRISEVYGASDAFLFGVTAGSASGPAIAVLTTSEPAVHRLAPDDLREWGREGGGPAELLSPVDITWNGSWIHVLDVGNRKIVRFSEDGDFDQARRLGPLWANRLDIVGGDTILGGFTPMADERAVVRLRKEGVDTLLRYRLLGEDHRLRTEGAPSFTVKSPFSAQVQWAVTADGELVWYDPEDHRLVRQGDDGTVLSSASIPWRGLPLTEADREWWIEHEIPSEFMGRRIFGPLRRVAREELDFPDTLSPVLAIEADAAGGVWIKRSLSVEGELWSQLRAGRKGLEFRLPPGRELLAVSESHVFALARDELGVETVEAYHRPR